MDSYRSNVVNKLGFLLKCVATNAQVAYWRTEVVTMTPRILVLVFATIVVTGCSSGQADSQTTQEEQPLAPVEQVAQETPTEQSPIPTATSQSTPAPTETPTTTPEPTATLEPTVTSVPTATTVPSATPLPPTPIPPHPTATPRNDLQEVFEAIRSRAEELDAEEKRLVDEINRNAIRFRVGEVTVDEVCANWRELASIYLEYHTFLSEIVAEHVDSFSSFELSLVVTMQSETESLLRDWFSENAEIIELCGI